MSAIPFKEDREEDWEPEADATLAPPGRRRRQFFTRGTAAVFAVIMCAAGFYAGVSVEKSHVSGSSAGARSFSLPTTSSSRSASGARSGAPSFPSGSGGGFPGLGGGNSSFGTIASVDHNTIYVNDASGNTVKVKLSSATKITKSLTVSKQSLHPGDSVVVQGLKKSGGTISATSVSDSGARGGGGSGGSGSSGSGGSSTTGSSASSAVNSLFGSGN